MSNLCEDPKTPHPSSECKEFIRDCIQKLSEKHAEEDKLTRESLIEILSSLKHLTESYNQLFKTTYGQNMDNGLVSKQQTQSDKMSTVQDDIKIVHTRISELNNRMWVFISTFSLAILGIVLKFVFESRTK